MKNKIKFSKYFRYYNQIIDQALLGEKNRYKGKLIGDKNPSSKQWLLTNPDGQQITFKVEHNRWRRGETFKNTIGCKLEIKNA